MEIPQGCGPGKYAVVKSMEKSSNQIVPGYLAKRSPNLDSTVYDLTSDYDFTRVPRDMGSTQMRIDFSNETGYWDMMVDKAGNKRRRKRDLEDFQGNHRRWLYDAWRDDNHENSDLSMEELHKRWFGSSVIDWLKGLLNGVTVTAEKTFSNNYQDNFKVILTDESYYCNLKGVDVEATLKTAANVGINVDTNLGLTIIGTIGDSGVDLKDSYVYFRNKGTVSTLFTLDAFASASFSTGDILILSADKFGVTFSVPGILTVGPNLKLYGSVDASFSLGAHLESNVNLVSWDVQQTYPIVTEDWQPKAIQSPDRDGTQELLQPTFNYSITADGHLTGHIKPMIVLGLDFHTKWIPLAPVTIGLVADGSVTVCATASASNSGGISACYGVNAGADLYATVQAPDLFGWKLSVPRYQLAPSQNIQIVPEQCTSLSKREDDLSYSMSQDTAMTDGLTLIEHRSTLKPRGAVYGPLSRFSALGITGTCPGDKTQGNDTQLTNVTCNNCGTYQEDDASVENVPLNRKRQNSAPSCQYLPGNGMGSRHSNELSARSLLDILGSDYAANESYHEIERRDSKSIEWYTGTTDYDVDAGSYPSCGVAQQTPQITRWFAFGKNTQYNLALGKYSSNQLAQIGRQTTDFETGHIFEVQPIRNFLLWIKGLKAPNPNVDIPWDLGFQQGTDDWVTNYAAGLGKGANANNAWTDSNGNELWVLLTQFLGGDGNPDGLALLLDSINGQKGSLFGLKAPTTNAVVSGNIG